MPSKINYGFILDENKEKIDEVILLPFVAPHSYTGEDVIEIQTHGNPTILNTILELILSKGARIAQRGEFTKRAFLNHRIDLSQAEAVLDIIHSKNMKSAKNALNNLSGALAQKINLIKEDLIKLYSKVIASIDFPEDVAEIETKEIVSICTDNINKINEIVKNAKSHDFIKDGFNVSLIGKPNVGKSSLFNAILNYNRSIVTSIEGTTRDTIKEAINLNGYLINFIDTAGIRDKNKADFVEQIGIDNSLESIDNSEIVFLAGGHVPTQNKFFKRIGLKEMLQDYNGVVIGQSAGSMNCAELVYVQPEEPEDFADPNFKIQIKIQIQTNSHLG